MFFMRWTTPYKGEVKTLKLTRDPMRHGLGHYTDTDGNVWDVYAIYGKGYTGHDRNYITARQVGHHPDYYGTHQGASSDGFHTWKPYYYEVVHTENRASRRAR